MSAAAIEQTSSRLQKFVNGPAPSKQDVEKANKLRGKLREIEEEERRAAWEQPRRQRRWQVLQVWSHLRTIA